MEKFSERIRECRKRAKVTQKEVADTLGISERGYQHYEGGKYEPHYARLIEIADFFKVSTDYLLGRIDDPAFPLAVNKKSP